MDTSDDYDTGVTTGHSILDLEIITGLAKKLARSRSGSCRWAQLASEGLDTLGAFAGDIQLKERTHKALCWVMSREEGPWQVSLNGIYTVEVLKAKDGILVKISVVETEVEEGRQKPRTTAANAEPGKLLKGEIKTGIKHDLDIEIPSKYDPDRALTYFGQGVMAFFLPPSERLQSLPIVKPVEPGNVYQSTQFRIMEGLISSRDKEKLRQGLTVWKAQATPSEGTRDAKVLEVLVAQNGMLPRLPNDISLEVTRFFAVTAKLGLWDEVLEKKDKRLAEALLIYYGEGLSQEQVGDRLGVSAATVNRLIKQGFDLLWNGLPNEPTAIFPFDKTTVFDQALLDGSGLARIAEIRHEELAIPGAKENRGAAIRRGQAASGAAEKMRQRALERPRDPEAVTRLREYGLKGAEARWHGPKSGRNEDHEQKIKEEREMTKDV